MRLKDSTVKLSWTSAFTMSSCHYAFKLLVQRRLQVILSRQNEIMNHNKLVSAIPVLRQKDSHKFEASLRYRERSRKIKGKHKIKRKMYKCRFLMKM